MIGEARPDDADRPLLVDRQTCADVGAQSPHQTLELGRRAVGVEQAIGGHDLLGVADTVLGLLDEWPVLVERAQQQISTEGLQACREAGEVVLGGDRLGALETHRPAVQAGGQAHDADTRLLIAGHDRPLDRGRSAPPGQQRGVDVEDLEGAEQRVRDQRPEGADEDRRALAR